MSISIETKPSTQIPLGNALRAAFSVVVTPSPLPGLGNKKPAIGGFVHASARGGGSMIAPPQAGVISPIRSRQI
ncbi:hypothetical protein ACVWY3_004044 [Bradyrhizobium sp. USDA 4486]